MADFVRRVAVTFASIIGILILCGLLGAGVMVPAQMLLESVGLWAAAVWYVVSLAMIVSAAVELVSGRRR